MTDSKSPEISEFFKEYSTDVIPQKSDVLAVSYEQASNIMKRIARIKEIGVKAVSLAFASICLKGAANAGAPDSMEVEVRCPDTKITTTISRYDFVMGLYAETGNKNIRKLAECLAPYMIPANLELIKKNPLLNLKGDLANRINRKLSLRKESPLTRAEEVCCATYAQWMPNLNELANSERLKGLLEEDLNARRKRNSKSTSNISPRQKTKRPQKDQSKQDKERKKLFES